ncbi:MAG: NADPH-dependent glutamate synthase [Candidatus Omnitrophica bacterium]|nr:NADPH-dependent glutamate synthase [Candidatus Omnitrophota bacterium]MBU4488285.1 NADPH-dependent glutamate synthase [Candidatus Omnitrophota bacterium]MCG2704499.1 NADPH-dependent glutamate synthase [Candidatus Omnitrophota bacterium]
MKKQRAEDRIKNFFEVALGLSEEEAKAEAKRCIQCKEPSCVAGCPVEIDIPKFIGLIRDGKYSESIKAIKEKNSLPAVCGRICPQEEQCELKCVLGKKGKPIDIGSLERFAADWELNRRPSSVVRRPNDSRNTEYGIRNTGAKVAVIGSGPGGLTCAADLARMGYSVTLFESLHKAGGVLVYGIPEFRLPKLTIKVEIEYIKSLGVDLKVDYVIGKTATIQELREEGFKAFYIGTGAGLPYFMGIPGENLNGVYSANEFLTRINLMKAYRFPEYDTPVKIGKRVGVIGGGNVAFDSARCAKRLGAEEVYIIYRRSRDEMPARHDEIKNAEEEGIIFNLLTNPVKCHGDEKGWLREVELVKNELGEPDASGRRSPVLIKGSNYRIPMDTIVVAIGQGPNPLLLDTIPEVKLNERGYIATDENCQTSAPDIFAGGDIVTGAATVILAMGAGKKAAKSIDKFLKTR